MDLGLDLGGLGRAEVIDNVAAESIDVPTRYFQSLTVRILIHIWFAIRNRKEGTFIFLGVDVVDGKNWSVDLLWSIVTVL